MALTEKQLKALRHRAIPLTRNRVRAAVELADVTLVAVAKATELPYSYISDVSAGRYQTITVANARKLADYFGCYIEDLFPLHEEASA